MKNTLVTVSNTEEENEISILVASEYTHSLFKHLKTLRVSCSAPEEAIFTTIRVEVDKRGNKTFQEKALESHMLASGTVDDFAEWIMEWQPEKGAGQV